jgi:hypothetical protein
LYRSGSYGIVDGMDEQELQREAAQIIGTDEEILAAAIFGLQDDYAKIFVAGAATGTAAMVAGLEGPLAAGAIGGVTIHAERAQNAASEGVTVRMLVAVTPTAIHLLDRTGLGETTRELMRFDRATTAVQVTKFGLSRTITLADEAAGKRIGLTGSTAFYVPEAAGDKLVLHLLSEPSRPGV